MIRVPHLACVLGALAWSAGWCLAGWILSACGHLDASGLAWASLPIAIAAATAWRAGQRLGAGGNIRWRRFTRHPAAAAFALLFVLLALSVVLHEPNNFDALTYRFPRVFQWVQAERWHWIDTPISRQNYSGTVAEWLHAPAWALAHSLRWPAWINLACFALLPGLTYLLLCGCGVRARIAREWMWLLPLGHGFLLQAASVGNDLLGAFFLLAAGAFARCSRTRPALAPWSVIALALGTGVKASNLFFVLPWLFLFPRDCWCLRRTQVVLVVAAAISILPTLTLNAVHTGHPTGDPLNEQGLRPRSMAAAVSGNLILAVWQNIVPPLWPWARATSELAEAQVLPRLPWILEGLPRFTLRIGELAQEEWAGLGSPLLLLLAVVAWHGRRPRQRRSASAWAFAHGTAVLVLFAFLGGETLARLLLPYYPLMVTAVLVRRAALPSSRVWTALVLMHAGIAAVVLVLNPARPLWPWQAVISATEAANPWHARAALVYSVYAQRADYLASVRDTIPDTEREIGFLAGIDDSEVPFWRPFGHRRVVTTTHAETLWAATSTLRFIAARPEAMRPAERWALRSAANSRRLRLVATHRVQTKAAAPPETWEVWEVRGDAQQGVACEFRPGFTRNFLP